MTAQQALDTLGLNERDLRWAAKAAVEAHRRERDKYWGYDPPFWRNRRERFITAVGVLDTERNP